MTTQDAPSTVYFVGDEAIYDCDMGYHFNVSGNPTSYTLTCKALNNWDRFLVGCAEGKSYINSKIVTEFDISFFIEPIQ